jgi:hypothetical protein
LFYKIILLFFFHDNHRYLEKYDHPLWQKFQNDTIGAGHGGMDFFVLHEFVEAIKNNTYIDESDMVDPDEVVQSSSTTDNKTSLLSNHT